VTLPLASAAEIPQAASQLGREHSGSRAVSFQDRAALASSSLRQHLDCWVHRPGYPDRIDPITGWTTPVSPLECTGLLGAGGCSYDHGRSHVQLLTRVEEPCVNLGVGLAPSISVVSNVTPDSQDLAWLFHQGFLTVHTVRSDSLSSLGLGATGTLRLTRLAITTHPDWEILVHCLRLVWSQRPANSVLTGAAPKRRGTAADGEFSRWEQAQAGRDGSGRKTTRAWQSLMVSDQAPNVGRQDYGNGGVATTEGAACDSPYWIMRCVGRRPDQGVGPWLAPTSRLSCY
jgi:hypothetical protein